MVLLPTSLIGHHHKITNITFSPTSLSPHGSLMDIFPTSLNQGWLHWTVSNWLPFYLSLDFLGTVCFRSEIVSNGEYQTSFEIIGRTIISISVSVYHSLLHMKVMNPRYLLSRHTILFINMSNFDKIKMVWPPYVSTYLTLSWVIIFEPA